MNQYGILTPVRIWKNKSFTIGKYHQNINFLLYFQRLTSHASEKLSILLNKSGTRPFPHILSLHFIIYKRVISLVCYWFYSSQKRDLAVVRNYAIFRSWYQRQCTRCEMKYWQHGNGFVMSTRGIGWCVLALEIN